MPVPRILARLVLFQVVLILPAVGQSNGGEAPGPAAAPGAAAAWTDRTMADFRRFTPEIRQRIVATLTRQIQLHPHPEIQRIVSLPRAERAGLPIAQPTVYHKAEQWAKGVAPVRSFIVRGDERHTAARRRIPARPFLPDLHRGVEYEWATGRIVRRALPLGPAEILENVYRGYPPGSDEVLARLLARFDSDPGMRKVAAYLEHLYADLDARVYEGITLYEAWYSGVVVDVPDVDAIPFEQRVLGKKTFRSPIPANARRTALYQQIQERAIAFRKYRTLREAAAMAFVRAIPVMDPTYAPLVPRFHYLYERGDGDVGAIADLLAGAADRDALIAAMDAQIAAEDGYDSRSARQQRLEEMQAWLRYWAQLAVWQEVERQRAAPASGAPTSR